MRKTYLFLSTFLAISLTWNVCAQTRTAPKSARDDKVCGLLAVNEICVKIGSAEPTTGAIGFLGQDSENGAQLAVNDVNAKGDLVINSQKVKLVLVTEDDAADPILGYVVAQKLVDAQVVAVVGHLNSGVSIPASFIYSQNGLVQVSPSSLNPDYTLKANKTPQDHTSAYRVIANDKKQGPALAQYLLRKGVKTVAIVDDATWYGED